MRWIIWIGCLCGAWLGLPAEGWGEVRSEPILSLHVEGRWDENLVDDGGDGSTLIRPGVGWRLTAPTAEAELVYLPDGLFYAGGGARRGGINQRLLGNQEIEWDRRTLLRLEQRFEQAFDPTGLTRPGVVRAAGSSTYGMAQADLSHRLTSTWTLGLGAREEVVWVDAPTAVNGAVHAPQGWSAWALGPRDTLTLWYRFQYFAARGGEDASAHEPRVGWGRTLVRHLRLELEAGPARYSEAGDSQWLPVGRASLVHRRPRLSLGVSYERSLFGATGFEGAVWGDAASVVATWLPARLLEATFVMGVFQNGAAPMEPAFVHGLAGAAVLSYALGNDLSAELTWRRIFQQQVTAGDLPALDISRNIVAIGLSWELGRDRRAR